MARKCTLGVIIGNRDFFPDRAGRRGRRDLVKAVRELDIEPSCSRSTTPSSVRSKRGSTPKPAPELFRDEPRRASTACWCALPNFGDEKGVADTLKLAGAERAGAGPGVPGRSRPALRRAPARCVLRQDLRLQQPAPVRHPVHAHRRTIRHPPRDRSSARTSPVSSRSCRVVRGLRRRARIGAVGARPNAFNTTRYSEKLLRARRHQRQHDGPVGVFGRAGRIADDDARVKAQDRRDHGYAPRGGRCRARR